MKIDIGQVVPGMIVNSDVQYNDSVLVSKGNTLTPRYIERLKAFGITSLDIITDKVEKSDENNNSNTKYTVSKNMFDSIRMSFGEKNYDKIVGKADLLVSTILRDLDLKSDFTDLTYDLRTFESTDDTINHSIRVAIYSIVLAHLYNKSIREKTYVQSVIDAKSIDLREIAVAALLHDRGRNCNGNAVLERIGKLVKNPDLTSQMPGLMEVPRDYYDEKYTSLYSYCLASDVPEISQHSKYMMLFSSETENGTGPLRPKGFEVEKKNSTVMASKIIHLCSLYDNMLSHCLYSGETFENIVSVLGQAASAKLVNEELANLFLSSVPIYPVGTRVILSNGEKAEVVKTFVEYTYATRPVVKILSTNQLINLRDHQSLTIDKVYLDEVTISDVIDNQINEMDGRPKGRL